MQQTARIKAGTAAARLGLQRSTLNRYLDRYSELRDENGLVDFEELVRHRGENPSITEDKPAAPKAPTLQSRKGSKGRVEEIKAWEAERDWALSIGQLTDPTKMLDEALDAVSGLRDKLMAPEHSLCERLAEERDPLAVKQILRDANRKMLGELEAAFMKTFADAKPTDDVKP